MRTVRLNTRNIDLIETGINPPMRKAITLPLKGEELTSGLCLYLAQSPFSDEAVSDEELREIAEHIADMVNFTVNIGGVVHEPPSMATIAAQVAIHNQLPARQRVCTHKFIRAEEHRVAVSQCQLCGLELKCKV